MPQSKRTLCVSGVNLVDCERIAKQLGCDVEPVNGTGEIRFTHPNVEKSVRVNGRRKDAPRALTTWLNHICRNA
jgi:hypothetical protein